jgi:hypothetical protein
MCKSLAKAKRQQKRAAHVGGDTTAWSDDEEDSSDEEWDIEKVLGEKARASKTRRRALLGRSALACAVFALNALPCVRRCPSRAGRARTPMGQTLLRRTAMDAGAWPVGRGAAAAVLALVAAAAVVARRRAVAADKRGARA